jgi:hypothetical protein
MIVASLPALVDVEESYVDDPSMGPYREARKWIEFVGEGSELDPIELTDEGSVPHREIRSPFYQY